MILYFISHPRLIQLLVFPCTFMIRIVYFCTTTQLGQQPRCVRRGGWGFHRYRHKSAIDNACIYSTTIGKGQFRGINARRGNEPAELLRVWSRHDCNEMHDPDAMSVGVAT